MHVVAVVMGDADVERVGSLVGDVGSLVWLEDKMGSLSVLTELPEVSFKSLLLFVGDEVVVWLVFSASVLPFLGESGSASAN